MDNEQLKTELSRLITALANNPRARTLAVDALERLSDLDAGCTDENERTRARIRARLLLMAYPSLEVVK